MAPESDGRTRRDEARRGKARPGALGLRDQEFLITDLLEPDRLLL